MYIHSWCISFNPSRNCRRRSLDVRLGGSRPTDSHAWAVVSTRISFGRSLPLLNEKTEQALAWWDFVCEGPFTYKRGVAEAYLYRHTPHSLGFSPAR